MTIKLGINGYGRIGRNILRALCESKERDIEIVAINDLGDLDANVHLTKYDTVHGKFSENVVAKDGMMIVGKNKIKVLSEREPSKLPWKELGVDLVLECTGLFASREKASAHLKAGAQKVLISAPAGRDVATVVYGINHQSLSPSETIVSNASCTTNCLAPIVKPLHDAFTIESGLMTTIHAYTNDQVLTDVYHQDLRRARSATQSMIPTKTGAAAAIGLVIPELEGKLDGFAMRVPTVNVSVVDLSIVVQKQTDVDTVNDVLLNATKGNLIGIAKANTEPLVSVDFNHDSHSSVFDLTQTKVIGNLVKVLSWYDNEWGFANRMLDVARVMMA